MKKIIVSLMMCLMVLNLGCSTMVYKDSKDQIVQRRARAAGVEPRALKVYPLDDGSGAAVTIDLLQPDAFEILAEQPLKQVGAAIVDGGAIFGLGYGIKEISDSMNDDGNSVPQSVAGDFYNINGDGNNFGDQTSN